jgi:hypothetical protein
LRLAARLAVAIACAVVTNDMARKAGPAGARARMSIVERILFVALVAAAASAFATLAFMVGLAVLVWLSA